MTIRDVEIYYGTDTLLSSLQRISHLSSLLLGEVSITFSIFVDEEIKTKMKGLVQSHTDFARKLELEIFLWFRCMFTCVCSHLSHSKELHPICGHCSGKAGFQVRKKSTRFVFYKNTLKIQPDKYENIHIYE